MLSLEASFHGGFSPGWCVGCGVQDIDCPHWASEIGGPDPGCESQDPWCQPETLMRLKSRWWWWRWWWWWWFSGNAFFFLNEDSWIINYDITSLIHGKMFRPIDPAQDPIQKDWPSRWSDGWISPIASAHNKSSSWIVCQMFCVFPLSTTGWGP